MKLIKPSITRNDQKPGIEGMYSSIRDAAAICYQTDTDKMKLSPSEFIDTVLMSNGHLRPLEFGTVYLKVPALDKLENDEKITLGVLQKNHWTRWKVAIDNGEYFFYITTNYRVIVIGGYLSNDKEAMDNDYDKNYIEFMKKFWSEPTENHQLRPCYTMLMSRGCSDDFRTHISLSSICESSRFCNYSKDKFGNELTFIQPYWMSDEDMQEKGSGVPFLKSLEKEEELYLFWAGIGTYKPQQLKRLYPLGAKVELRLCGFPEDWENFFWRRCDSHADPECQVVANMIKDDYTRTFRN